jgi:hypothetical protein
LAKIVHLRLENYDLKLFSLFFTIRECVEKESVQKRVQENGQRHLAYSTSTLQTRE